MKRTINDLKLDLYNFAISQGFRDTLNASEIPSFEYLYEECKSDYELSILPAKYIKPVPKGFYDGYGQ